MFAALFPGQGSQELGMGRELYEGSTAAREVLDHAEAVLPGLLAVMWEGPAEELQLTANQQPALLAVSTAAWAAWREAGGLEPCCAAGHSLGEWSAHVAAGSLELEDALRLVRKRGQYMQEAVPAGQGAMAAVLKLSDEQVSQVIDAIPGVEAANFNSPGQVVISGLAEAVRQAAAELKQLRGRVIPLKVSAPFHSSLMQPARQKLAADLASVELKRPRFPVYANVTAEPVSDPERIRELLLEQITSPVRWVEILKAMAARGVSDYYEFGSGNVLSGLVRRTLENARAVALNTPADIKSALEEA